MYFHIEFDDMDPLLTTVGLTETLNFEQSVLCRFYTQLLNEPIGKDKFITCLIIKE
jgi:hypothetical protein